MVINKAYPIPDGEYPDVETSDGGNTWDWECPECYNEHKEAGTVAEHDLLICDKCGEKYRNV